MTSTLFVEFRDDGFWVYEPVSAVFLKHLIDEARSYLGCHDEAWLSEAVEGWRISAVIPDLGFYMDDSWSREQIDTLTALTRAACEALSKRDKIPAKEIESWQMVDDLRCFARGLSAVMTASAIQLGEALIRLVNGTLPEPPPGTAWFFTPEGCTTIPMKEMSFPRWDMKTQSMIRWDDVNKQWTQMEYIRWGEESFGKKRPWWKFW